MTALIERVTDRHPSPPPTPRERRAIWAYRYYLLPVNSAVVRLPIPRHKALVPIY